MLCLNTWSLPIRYLNYKINFKSDVWTLRRVGSTDPGISTTLQGDLHWLHVNPGANHAVLTYRCQIGLTHSSMLMTFTGWRRSSLECDCGTDCASHGAFYERLLCRCRSGVEQPSALGDVTGVSSSFQETSQDNSFDSTLPVITTFYYVLHCYLVVLRLPIMCSFLF